MTRRTKRRRKSPVRWDEGKQRWIVTYWISPASGLPKRKRRRRRDAQTEDEAWGIFRQLEDEYGHHVSNAKFDPDILLRTYFEDWQIRVRKDYAAKTYKTISDNMRLHVLPKLGHLKIRDITAGDVRRFLESKKRTKGTLERRSEATILTMPFA